VVLLQPLWRFQVSNGAVSLAGNAVLMKLLVGRAHLPVLVASCVAIFVCGLVNFWLGDNWAFAAIDCHGNVKCYRSGAVPTTTGCGGV
jgi:putative flippase GtrA